MPPHKLSPEVLTAAIEGFQQQKIRIDAQIQELRTMLPGGRTEPVAAPEVPKGKRRKMSAAARKRIGDAQRKRWAESKGNPEAPSKTVTTKPKRKMSAAGRKAISEATKKRWAAFHAANKSAAKKAPTKVAKKTAMKKSRKKVAKAPAGTETVAA
jgi:hypothetical protein